MSQSSVHIPPSASSLIHVMGHLYPTESELELESEEPHKHTATTTAKTPTPLRDNQRPQKTTSSQSQSQSQTRAKQATSTPIPATSTGATTSSRPLVHTHSSGSGSGSGSGPVSSHPWHPARMHVMTTCLIVLFAVLVRVLVGSDGYSGKGKPPMYGDYEAQRHWMEITWNLPINTWYHNTTDNNLSYWGLDYPPLTAYVSWICGAVAHRIEPSLVALHTSHGYESISSQLFMRWTVIICDLIIWFPAIFFFLHHLPISSSHRISLLLLLCMHPSFILIDHGHFQYNNVSLGLVLASLSCFLTRRRHLHWGSLFFCLSLSFKQMSLYYAPAYFIFLASYAIWEKGWIKGFTRIATIGAVVLVTFGIMLAPLAFSTPLSSPPPPHPLLPSFINWSGILQLFHRLFPFGRGLYEDKVANIWCATSLIIKWQQRFSQAQLVNLSLSAVLTFISPSLLHLIIRRPTAYAFQYSLILCSFGFFLFGFQVHEKTILLPLLSLLSMISYYPLLVIWCSVIATFSMFPLLIRDGCAVPYVVMQIMWTGMGYSYIRGWMHDTPIDPSTAWIYRATRSTTTLHLSYLSLAGCILIHIIALVIPHNPRYPDLITYLFICYSAIHFILFALWFHILQWMEPYPSKQQHIKVE